MQKKITFIARYNEDITWTSKLESDIFIYNKGAEWPWDDIPRVDRENLGLEAETFLNAIIEYYEILPNYETVIFSQGHPFDHCSNAIEKINNATKDTFEPFVNIKNLVEMPSEDICYSNGLPFICLSYLHAPEFKYEWRGKYEYGVCKNYALYDVALDVIWFGFMCKTMGIDIKNKDFIWHSSAQYIVPSEKILNKSKKWWQELYKYCIHSMKDYDKGGGSACNFERFWWTIYNYSENQ